MLDRTYRIATVSDLPLIAEARWDARAEAGEPAAQSRADFCRMFVEEVAAWIRSADWTYWIAIDEHGALESQIAIKIVRGIPRPARASDQWGYVTDCYTRPDRRDQGIGTILLGHTIAWARAEDLEMLLVWPSERSRRWYARAGFEGSSDPITLALRDFDATASSSPHIDVHGG